MILDYIYNFISRGSGFFVKWLLNVIFATTMLISEYGIYTYYISIAYILTSFLLFGFEVFSLNKSRNDDFYLKISVNINEILVVIFLLGVIISFFSFSLGCLVIAISVSQLFIVYSKSIGQYRLEAVGSFVSLLFVLALTLLWKFGFINFTLTSKYAMYFFSCVVFICSLPSLLAFSKKNNIDLFKKEYFYKSTIIKSYIDRKIYGYHELTSVANQHVFVLLCANILSYNDLGIYKIGQLYLTPLILIPASMSQVLLKRLSKNDDKKTFYYIIILSIMLFIIALLMLPLINTYIWNGLSDSVLYVYLLYALTLSVQVLNVFIGCKLTINNLQKDRARNSFISFIITVILTFCLSIQFGIIGVSVSLLSNYLILMSLNFYSYEKYKRMFVGA